MHQHQQQQPIELAARSGVVHEVDGIRGVGVSAAGGGGVAGGGGATATAGSMAAHGVDRVVLDSEGVVGVESRKGVGMRGVGRLSSMQRRIERRAVLEARRSATRERVSELHAARLADRQQRWQRDTDRRQLRRAALQQKEELRLANSKKKELDKIEKWSRKTESNKSRQEREENQLKHKCPDSSRWLLSCTGFTKCQTLLATLVSCFLLVSAVLTIVATAAVHWADGAAKLDSTAISTSNVNVNIRANEETDSFGLTQAMVGQRTNSIQSSHLTSAALSASRATLALSILAILYSAGALFLSLRVASGKTFYSIAGLFTVSAVGGILCFVSVAIYAAAFPLSSPLTVYPIVGLFTQYSALPLRLANSGTFFDTIPVDIFTFIRLYRANHTVTIAVTNLTVVAPNLTQISSAVAPNLTPVLNYHLGWSFWLMLAAAVVSITPLVAYALTLCMNGLIAVYSEYREPVFRVAFLPVAALLWTVWIISCVGVATLYWSVGANDNSWHFGLAQAGVNGELGGVSQLAADENITAVCDITLAFCLIAIVIGFFVAIYATLIVMDALRSWKSLAVYCAATAALLFCGLIVFGAGFPSSFQGKTSQLGYSYWLTLSMAAMYSLPPLILLAYSIKKNLANAPRSTKALLASTFLCLLSFVLALSALRTSQWQTYSDGGDASLHYSDHFGLLSANYKSTSLSQRDFTALSSAFSSGAVSAFVLLLMAVLLMAVVIGFALSGIIGGLHMQLQLELPTEHSNSQQEWQTRPQQWPTACSACANSQDLWTYVAVIQICATILQIAAIAVYSITFPSLMDTDSTQFLRLNASASPAAASSSSSSSTGIFCNGNVTSCVFDGSSSSTGTWSSPPTSSSSPYALGSSHSNLLSYRGGSSQSAAIAGAVFSLLASLSFIYFSNPNTYRLLDPTEMSRIHKHNEAENDSGLQQNRTRAEQEF